jgi:hypothetical protein
MRERYYRALHWTCCTALHVYVLGLRVIRRFTRRARVRTHYAQHEGLIGDD